MKPTLAELDAAAARVHAVMPPTPQYNWPLLSARAGCEVWVEPENHTPTGAFKVRGGIVSLASLQARNRSVRRVIAATRGNHGPSVAYAARRLGRAAMRYYFSDTHNVVEGAAAAPLAALLAERDRMRGARVAVIAAGGNVDGEVFATVLGEDVRT